MKGVPMIAVGYTRVSTDQQAATGVSLAAQAEKIKAMAVVQDAHLLEVVTDAGASAKTLNRPGLAQLLDLVDRRQVQTVIVAKLDRLTRSVRDLGELLDRFQRRGVSLVSVAESLDTGTAAGRLVLNIMSSVSQWEREAIGERTRDALQHKKARGERVGTVPFGSRLDDDGRTLIPNPAEQEIVTLVQACRDGGYSLRAIAAELNRQGYQTRRGTSWRFQYVKHILAAAA